MLVLLVERETLRLSIHQKERRCALEAKMSSKRINPMSRAGDLREEVRKQPGLGRANGETESPGRERNSAGFRRKKENILVCFRLL